MLLIFQAFLASIIQDLLGSRKELGFARYSKKTSSPTSQISCSFICKGVQKGSFLQKN